MKYWVELNENNIVISRGTSSFIPEAENCIEITFEQFSIPWLLGSLYQNGEFIEQPQEITE